MKKTFKKLTAAQKRVAIAKDVLKQIKAERTTIKSNSYWNVEGCDLDFDSEVDQTILRKRSTRCTCCAAGAAVLSGIRLFNKATIQQENGGRGDLVKSRYFSQPQMGLIEAAFEESAGGHLIGNSRNPQYQKASYFNKEIDDDKGRAVRIFQNIIKNGGTFKP